MSSTEFGVMDRRSSISVGSTAPRRKNMHTRARSLFSSIRPSTSHRTQPSSSITMNTTKTTTESEVTSTPDCGLPAMDDSIGSSNLHHQHSRSNSHNRRMRWSTFDEWRNHPSLSTANFDPEEFLGLAVTTPFNPKKAIIVCQAGRKKTEQALRNYHRPTQINYELWPEEQRAHHQRNQSSSSTFMSSVRGSGSSQFAAVPFQGNLSDWSPAILPIETFKPNDTNMTTSPYSHQHPSSSLLSLNSDYSRPCTPFGDDNREVWRVTSEGDEEVMTAFVSR